MEKMFEKATRKKLRFETSKGNITVEDLWELPLASKDGFDLDNAAKVASRKLKETQEESFVKPVSVANSDLALKLEIVKYIISVKLDEKTEREASAEKTAKKQKIMEIMNRKQDAALEGKSLEELERELASL